MATEKLVCAHVERGKWPSASIVRQTSTSAGLVEDEDGAPLPPDEQIADMLDTEARLCALCTGFVRTYLEALIKTPPQEFAELGGAAADRVEIRKKSP